MMCGRHARGAILAVALVGLCPLPSLNAAAPPAGADLGGAGGHAGTQSALASLHAYIARNWSKLTRSHTDLAAAILDPKLTAGAAPAPLYVSAHDSLRAIRDRLRAELVPPSGILPIPLRQLPRDDEPVEPPGLIYLPRPYVAPGGRFNEMYGWDSYFIVLGLLEDGQLQSARDLVDDAIYEVDQFGKVLNANRTYYLLRSQPPLLTAMVRAVFERTHDRAWLAGALPAVRRFYRYWTRGPHLAGDSGLSRYYGGSDDPAHEVVTGERDQQGRSHYDRVRDDLRDDPPEGLDVSKYYNRQRNALTPLAYRSDRSMRESGFDPTNRFGPFSFGILDLAPVCLNSFLYRMELDIAWMLQTLGEVGDGPKWKGLAAKRGRLIRELLWSSRDGLFEDYDFVRRQRRSYPFATTFLPLWVGAASPEQARRIVATALPLLGRPGGLLTSTNRSGSQWDAPFAWAPLQLFAVEGLRRYGYENEADALSLGFLRTVLRHYARTGVVFEKFDLDEAPPAGGPALRYGYLSNEIGFGWTNGVFLRLEAELPPAGRAELATVDGAHAR